MASVEKRAGRGGFFKKSGEASSKRGIDPVCDFVHLCLLLVCGNSAAYCLFGSLVLFLT